MSTILFDPCCKGCLSQELYGENRCAGCRYFEPAESVIDRRPILYISQRQLDEIKVEEARLRIKRSVTQAEFDQALEDYPWLRDYPCLREGEF
jgi:hypothetical protein